MNEVIRYIIYTKKRLVTFTLTDVMPRVNNSYLKFENIFAFWSLSKNIRYVLKNGIQNLWTPKPVQLVSLKYLSYNICSGK